LSWHKHRKYCYATFDSDVRFGSDKAEALKLSRTSVEPEDFRDGSQTAAVEGGADPLQADVLPGHKTGMRDRYLKRNPRYVADACKKVEAYYFGTG